VPWSLLYKKARVGVPRDESSREKKEENYLGTKEVEKRRGSVFGHIMPAKEHVTDSLLSNTQVADSWGNEI